VNQIELAPLVVEGGFFLLKASRSAPPAPYAWQSDTGTPRRFLGTYRDSGAPIRESLVDALRAARRRVFVASFMLGDERLLEEFIAAADRLQGGVYVITALDERSLRKGLDEYELTEQEAPEERKKNFERLTSAGVYVRGHESCHAKFAVIDDHTAIVGSANFVTNGFEWTGEGNVLLKDPAGVQQLARLFTELWFEGCAWEVPPGLTYVVAQRAAEEPPVRPDQPTGDPSDVVWTHGGETSPLLDAIHSTINAARYRLALSTYSIVGIREHPSLLLEPVREAVKKRGVAARLFVRQRNAFPDQMADLIALHHAGVEIHADTRNHMKIAVADERLAVVFSANLHAYQGLRGSVEAGVRLSDQQTVHELLRYLDHAVEHADTRFVRDPTHAQLNGFLAARWCKTWPWGDEVRILCSAQEARQFADAANCGPVLYEAHQGKLFLYAADCEFEIDTRSEGWTGKLAKSAGKMTAAARLDQWLRSVRDRPGSQPAESRGFCAAKLVLEDYPC
jgi:phosphatidylserine/phosphatidylglycerophosphate/cardiolipin synthase-like enzyme